MIHMLGLNDGNVEVDNEIDFIRYINEGHCKKVTGFPAASYNGENLCSKDYCIALLDHYASLESVAENGKTVVWNQHVGRSTVFVGKGGMEEYDLMKNVHMDAHNAVINNLRSVHNKTGIEVEMGKSVLIK